MLGYRLVGWKNGSAELFCSLILNYFLNECENYTNIMVLDKVVENALFSVRVRFNFRQTLMSIKN